MCYKKEQSMDLRQLSTVEALSEATTICQFHDVKIIRVANKTAEAGISLYGGQLLWFKPVGEKEVIWLSELALFDKTKPIRGGIPICWPWFGNTGGEQTHGFARNVDWTFIGHEETEDSVVITLGLTECEETKAIWPHKFDNLLKFEIGKELKVSLTSTNTDDHDWSYSGALHSYLEIGDIDTISVTGMGNKYIDGVQGYVPAEGSDVLTIDSETIHIYTEPQNPIIVDDKSNQRNINVVNEGHDAAVIWSPWEAQSVAMGDMRDDGYKVMMCVESAIYSEFIKLAPGESHALSTILSIDKS